jgi:L-lactate dehydrogenase complex protein LldE
MCVGLFIPYFADEFSPNFGIVMVGRLQRLNVKVFFPPAQTCCDQPMFNVGYRDEARQLAKGRP